MPRTRIEGLLASFPKLIGSSDQHTFVETDAVRYVYQPQLQSTCRRNLRFGANEFDVSIVVGRTRSGANKSTFFIIKDEIPNIAQRFLPLEELFLVLITNKQSNILQDIDSLHLFARIVSETCRSHVDEREVSRNAFELINVFDEVVSIGGYRESVNLGHVRTIVEMESHEERIQEEIERNKEREAKEELARKAKLMDAQRREMAKKGYTGGGAGGFGSNSGGNFGGSYGGFKSGGSGGVGFDSSSVSPTPKPYDSTPSYPNAPVARSLGKGMQLGKKQDTTQAMFEAIKKDEGLVDTKDKNASLGRPGVSASNVQREGVHIAIDERISARVSRDGGLENMEVKGKMELQVTDPAKAYIRVALANAYNETIQFTTHPNVDKTLFATGVIGLKDPTKPFPVSQILPLVKWRLITKDDALMPISINCWPSPSGNGTCDVNIEYDLQTDRIDLRDVTISVPYPGTADPVIQSADGQSYKIQRQTRTIDWQLPLIDQSNRNGMLEFTVADEDVNGFFPIKVTFNSIKPYCSVNVGDVVAVDGSTRIAFSQETLLTTEEYVIV
ncbi:Coatomer subunit delta [Physocladia obscura]|uniref:Coatomer subunit delta n=1 Tax=Physocladia obscura TaxID=109957 RepID=A0AAD5SYD9_9FUNG|nr:Coatomer subunit delta [Physocladia obscura]